MLAYNMIKLNNGVEIPEFGLGVFRSELGTETSNAVRWALEAGYRHIDTAMMYRNEADVARGIRESGVPREDILSRRSSPCSPSRIESLKRGRELACGARYRLYRPLSPALACDELRGRLAHAHEVLRKGAARDRCLKLPGSSPAKAGGRGPDASCRQPDRAAPFLPGTRAEGVLRGTRHPH